MKRTFSLLCLMAALVSQAASMPADTTSRIAKGVRLDDVVVYGAHNNFGVTSSQMSAIELTKKQIMATPTFLGEQDVLKSLQKLPGVQSSNDGTAGIFVRGGDYDQNYITLDGSAIYNAEHMKGFVSAINPDVVQSVNFYRGGFPARYGSRLSSVVDVGIKAGDFNRYHGSVSIGMLSARAQVEGPILKGRTSFNVAARVSYFGLIARPLLKSIYERPESLQPYEELSYYDLTAKFVHRFNDAHRLSAVVYFGKDDDTNAPTKSSMHFSNKEDPYVRWMDQYEQDSKRNNSMDNNWHNLVSSLYWTAQLSPTLRLNTNLSFSQYKYWLNYKSTIERETNDWYRLYHLYKENSSVTQNNDISDLALTADATWNVHPRHVLRTGAKLSYQSLAPGTTVDRNSYTKTFRGSLNYDGPTLEPEYTEKRDNLYSHTCERMPIGSVAIYAEDDFTATDHFKFNYGLRLATYMVKQKTYFSAEPRLSMRYLITPDFSVKLSYSRMAQAIHRLISGNLVMASDIWAPITKDIPLMTSHMGGMALNYNLPLGFELTVEGYYKTLDNVLDYRNGATASMSEAGWESLVAIGRGRSYGVELLLERRTGNTTGWISYTWSKSLRTFDRPGQEIDAGEEFYASNDRRHNLSATLTQHFDLSSKVMLDLTAAFTYQSGRRGTIPTTSLFGYTVREQEYKVDDGHFSYFDVIAGFDEANLYKTYLGNVHNSPLQIHTFKTRNDYRLPDAHHLDISATLTRKCHWGNYAVGLSLYNIYNQMNVSNVYVGYDKNHLVLKGICPFPFMPSLNFSLKF
ncbi:MAG: TonB-dependent receptor [Muribaculaceae bacterium]|nr:TonB-dependent receptor [Muribaculaceae bacterium]